MRDFNFFDPYLNKKNKLSKKQLALYIFISVVFFALAITPILNVLNIKKMEEKTMLASSIVDSEEAKKEREEINSKQNQIRELKEYYETLADINSEITKIDLINDLFLQAITDRVPEEVFFQNINISQDSIRITGIAKNNVSIAEFEQNLRGFTYFQNVFISNITATAGGYSFAISFQIKGGIDDETN